MAFCSQFDGLAPILLIRLCCTNIKAKLFCLLENLCREPCVGTGMVLWVVSLSLYLSRGGRRREFDDDTRAYCEHDTIHQYTIGCCPNIKQRTHTHTNIKSVCAAFNGTCSGLYHGSRPQTHTERDADRRLMFPLSKREKIKTTNRGDTASGQTFVQLRRVVSGWWRTVTTIFGARRKSALWVCGK